MKTQDVQSDVEQIKDLESRAGQLRTLLEKRSVERADRPLIIEFSGAPKAGKTRSISILELFLKRNGIKVEVFTERASIAPIKSKGHLNFNVWVSCASLQGMLEALYQDLDVFILDRGVFDALVWNEWLEMTGKITPQEAVNVAQFFMMHRWTDLVDLIFVLTCDPSVSIEREFADQLTTKRGTIMEEGTLKQFKEATEKTMKKYSTRFKRIVPIDTTKTTTRQGAAVIVDETLKVLSGFLDESIGVVPVNEVKVPLPEAGFVSDTKVITGFVETFNQKKTFTTRSQAEQNANFLQPIPCAILRYENKILVLKRKKPGHRLHDTYAVWAGGHVVEADSGPEILLSTLDRELTEELFIKESYDLNRTPIGLIRTNEDARASRHIGVLYEITLKSNDVALALNQKEFRSTRGTSMSGKLIEIAELKDIYDEMGDWSRFIVAHFWPELVREGKKQPQLFSQG
jgi:predicted NUDIX family phosphoesterase